jgi:hypothetical protein
LLVQKASCEDCPACRAKHLEGRWINSGGLLALPSIRPVRYRASQRARIKVNVRSNLLNSVRRRRSHSALACLLLLTICYGAIVEAAHSHGSSSSHPSRLTTVSNSSDSQSSYQGHSNPSDCSLCQFQRQLFGGLVDVILVAHTPQQTAFLFEETPSYLSTSALPPSGRAPPLV